MDKETIETYDRSAQGLAAKFDEIPVRIGDIQETFSLVGKKNPKVLEIGCGNGRDAAAILKSTNDFLGIDASQGMIALAKKNVPGGTFAVADMEDFVMPKNLDIVFAFASLLHVSKESFKDILNKVWDALNPGGAVRISLKYRDKYTEFLKDDDFGSRKFYYYSKQDIEDMAGDFVIRKNELMSLRGNTWLEVLLQKPLSK